MVARSRASRSSIRSDELREHDCSHHWARPWPLATISQCAPKSKWGPSTSAVPAKHCRAAAEAPKLRAAVRAIAAAIVEAFRAGHKLLIAGNGGSAADAQHIAGEFLSRLNFDRNPLPAIALTTDSSVLTAIGNDYGFERTFERQVRGLGKPGDVFMAISTSGRSPNVVAALKA